jgi:hypothetical protein
MHAAWSTDLAITLVANIQNCKKNERRIVSFGVVARVNTLVEKKGFCLELSRALSPVVLRTQTKGCISTGS